MCGDGAGMRTASAGMMRGLGQDFGICGDGDGVQSCGDGVRMGLMKFAQCGDGDGLCTPCHSLVASCLRNIASNELQSDQ
jgi:hypothetical protein